ncbi:MAG: hypothetical protein WBE86_06825 [Candidatus Acidiferrales bacterium]
MENETNPPEKAVRPQTPNTPILKSSSGWWTRFISNIKRKMEERAAKKKQEAPADKAARRTANATVCMAIFTIVLAVVSGGTLCILNRQLNVMAADQRPWLQVKSAEIGFLKFDTDIVNFNLKIILKNTGRTPATGIEIQPSFLAATEETFRSENAIEQADCAEAGKKNYATRETGLTVFPDDTEPVSTVPTMRIVDIPIGPLRDGRRGAAFVVLGCFDYFISSDHSERGQTGFRFIVAGKRPTPDIPNIIYATPGILGPSDLLIAKDLYGNYAK